MDYLSRQRSPRGDARHNPHFTKAATLHISSAAFPRIRAESGMVACGPPWHEAKVPGLANDLR